VPSWHAEIALLQLCLRRYPTDDAQSAFAARAPYDGIATATIRDGEAWLSGMLVAGTPLTREDRRQIATLMRQHGAVVLHADRHGRLVQWAE